MLINIKKYDIMEKNKNKHKNKRGMRTPSWDMQIFIMTKINFTRKWGQKMSPCRLCRRIATPAQYQEGDIESCVVTFPNYSTKAAKALEITSKNVYNPSEDTAVYMIIDGNQYVAQPQSYAQPLN